MARNLTQSLQFEPGQPVKLIEINDIIAGRLGNQFRIDLRESLQRDLLAICKEGVKELPLMLYCFDSLTVVMVDCWRVILSSHITEIDLI